MEDFTGQIAACCLSFLEQISGRATAAAQRGGKPEDLSQVGKGREACDISGPTPKVQRRWVSAPTKAFVGIVALPSIVILISVL